MIKTFPKMGQIYKLFRDDYHNLMKNIYPCILRNEMKLQAESPKNSPPLCRAGEV